MATVPNKADGGAGAADKPYMSPNRLGAGSPLGVEVPEYAGEIWQDSDTGNMWRAEGVASDSWTPIGPVLV